MQPISLWALLLCLWLLTNLWLLPLSRDRWKAVDLRQKIARAGGLVALEKVRDLAAIGSIVVGAVTLLVSALHALSLGSAEAPKALIDAAASSYAVVKAWSDGYAGTLGVIALVGAAITLFLAARHARKRISQAWVTKAEEVHARLRQDASAIEAARADPELEPLVRRLDALIERLGAHDGEADGSKLGGAELEQIRDEISQVLSALAIETARKELTFDTALATPAEEEKAAPPTALRRFARVLASERFCKDLGLVKKPLSHVVSGLLVLSLLGWTAEPLANSLQLAVNNLRVNLLDKKAQRDLESALSQAQAAPTPAKPASDAPSPPNAAAVQAATRLLARAAVRDMARSGIVDRLARVERSALREAEFVRAAIGEQQVGLAERPDSAAAIRREVAESIAKNADDAPRAAHVEQQIQRAFQPQVERLQRDNPARFAQWLASVERRYATPQTPLDAQGKLISRMLDDAFGGLDGGPSSELGKQGQKLAKDFGKEATKTWANAFAKSWLGEAIVDSARPEVMARAAANFGFEASDETRRFARTLAEAHGEGWVGSAAAQREAQATRAVAQKVAGLHREDRALQQAVLERLGGYDQLFPPHAPESPAGGGGGKGGPQSGPHPSGSGKAFAQARATDFKLASRSFRVRGVLIGQDLTGKGLNVTRLRWKLQAPGATHRTPLTIEVEANGQWKDIGSFDAGVVNQALRYAADRRVVATTITPGDGKVVGRVTYLHPALADTPLGCRVVEVDRLIDTFSFRPAREKPPADLASLSEDRQQMGRWMDFVAVAELVSSVPRSQACPRDDLERVLSARKLRGLKLSSGLSKSLDDFLAQQEQKLPGSTQFLRSAQACTAGAGDQAAACLCEQVRAPATASGYWFPEDHTSQFRERRTDAGPDWSWMKPSPDRLTHIDLWVHTTFALRKSASSGDADVDEATATPLDFPAPQLDALRRAIAEGLPKYLKDSLRSPSYDDFMGPLEDFVLLQRLFRTAFAGALGRDFPLAQLIGLERETRRFVPSQPTIRWEPAQSERALEDILRQADGEAAVKYLGWKNDQLERIALKKPACDRVSN